jgi:DNA-binding beta-propeller fold protein YncE/predicted Ser/Thr protein kinase
MGEPAIGSTLAGYRIDELIARGGMGVVYRATHLALERQVALKVIARHLAEQEGFRERFLRESRLAARLDHPHVVPVYDAREEDGELIVAMRFVRGGDLKKRIAARGPLPPPEAIEMLAQVADALDAAHAAGIVHRDVKPHNILLEGDRAYLTDFGLAKALGDSGVLSDASVVGTAEYMSPEQWRGSRVGPAADVYSLGCVLYEAVTGIAPFARQAGDSEPEMPRGLDAVIERAVAKEPADRHPSAGALIAAARERQGATPTATAVLTEAPDRPTLRLGERTRALEAEPAGRRALLSRGPWPFVAGLALAAAALAAVVFLLLGGDDVSVSDPIEVGDSPLRLAVDGEAVWATSGREGVLVEIEPGPGGPDKPAVLPDLRVVKRIPVDRGASAIAVGQGSLWVTSPWRGQVLRIDPADGRLLERVDVGGRPGAIVYGGGRVWVADKSGRGVTAINPGGEVFKRGIAPHAHPLRLAVGAGAVWVSSASTGNVRRIAFDTASAAEPIPTGRGPAGITVGGGDVWVATTRGDTVAKVSPAFPNLPPELISVGDRPGGIDAGTSVVWVANTGDGTVSRIDMESGETIGDPIGVGPEPGAVAVGEEAVWVANNGDGTVTRIEP